MATPSKFSTPSTLSATSTPSPPRTTIIIGGTAYSIDISKIPYFSNWIASQSEFRPDQFIHEGIRLIDVALCGIEHGYHASLRKLPADLERSITLCGTYDFLGINVLAGKSFDDVFADLKACQRRATGSVEADRATAREAAFRLLYMMLKANSNNYIKDRIKLFNAVKYVTTRSMFGYRAREAVMLAYKDRFFDRWGRQKLLLKQWKRIQKRRKSLGKSEHGWDNDQSMDIEAEHNHCNGYPDDSESEDTEFEEEQDDD